MIRCLSPQKGDCAYEENYCSKYCRLYDERKLEWVAYDTDCPNHKNKLKWPRILINCEMCGDEIHLLHDIERREPWECCAMEYGCTFCTYQAVLYATMTPGHALAGRYSGLHTKHNEPHPCPCALTN